MIKLIYWLINKRWAICKECKHYQKIPLPGNHFCGCYPEYQEPDFITGEKGVFKMSLCFLHNNDGVCWGFREKAEV
jgi:hypothetical protein